MTVSFTTERLLAAALGPMSDAVLAALFAPEVIADLPPGFGSAKTPKAQREFLNVLAQEAQVLGIYSSEDIREEPLGLLILSEDEEGVVHLGYLLRRAAWGRGLASEIIAGLCRYMKDRVLVGGVVPGNTGSIRVLEKSGFALVDKSPEQWSFRREPQ